MAAITAFKALRFTEKAGSLENLICPPYDIISDAERQGFLNKNGHNIIRLELPREGENPYETAGETYRSWIADGILRPEEKPALYIYEEEFEASGTRRVKGFTCRVRLEEFSKGVVLPHEETLPKAKADRFELMKAAAANFSSIYSLYFDEENKIRPLIDSLSAGTPDAEAADGAGIIHRLWVVTDEAAIEKIAGLMAEKKLYIADGHHRYETALNYREYLKEKNGGIDEKHPAHYIMMQLVNIEHEGLVVLPTHRALNGVDSFDAAKLTEVCREHFEVTPIDKNETEAKLKQAYDESRKAFVMYAQGKTVLLTLKDAAVMESLLPGKSAAHRSLDVAILHTLVFEKLMGLDSAAAREKLAYIRGADETMEFAGENGLAFIVNPVKVPEIAAVAAAGEKMPQKTTYFYPKLITGLTINPLD